MSELHQIKEDLGYIKRSLEVLVEKTTDNSDRLTKIENEVSLYKTLVKAAKLAGYGFILVLSLKFGDLKTLWTELFGK